MKKYTLQQFIQNAQAVHGNTYDYSLVDYVGIMEKVIIICREHGNFLQTAYSHINKRARCPTCGIIADTAAKTHTTEQFIQNAQRVHGDKYDYSKVEYISSKPKVKILCKIHGSFLQTPNDHISARSGCPKCGAAVSHSTTTFTTTDFIQKSREIHGDKYDYSLVNYINNHTPVQIVCNIHGPFFQIPSDHTWAKSGCKRCTHRVSSKENAWLSSLDVPTDEHHRQVALKIGTGRRRHVDGFDPNTNTIYEFWGDYWHGNPAKYSPTSIHPVARITFGELYEKTQQKRQQILDAGYTLVEIWESDYDNSVKQSFHK